MHRTEIYTNSMPFEDHVYANGDIVRIDRSAAQVKNILKDYGITSDNVLWAGVTFPYGLYTHSTLSYYQSGTSPFGSNNWYGTKKNLTTGEIRYKVEDSSYSGDFASKTITYTSSGDILSYDYYAYWTIEEAKSFCSLHNLTYPIPSLYEDNVWIWGVTYDLSNNPVVVKAYRKVR